MSDFSAEEHALLDEAAAALVRRRLATPAMMALETLVPMNLVTASMLHVMSPLWRVALPASRIDAVARLLERREAIPELIRAIDAAEERRRLQEREERDARAGRAGTR
ncbi:MAG TPA: hypothetical protein VFD43_13485 [Planctomycetota bacterium]|nr:hypothetical protein [Planctomycetota bacterium]